MRLIYVSALSTFQWTHFTTPATKRNAVKPRYSAPAFNIIPLIEHTNFGPKKCFIVIHLLAIENLSIKHNLVWSLKIHTGFNCISFCNSGSYNKCGFVKLLFDCFEILFLLFIKLKPMSWIFLARNFLIVKCLFHFKRRRILSINGQIARLESNL